MVPRRGRHRNGAANEAACVLALWTFVTAVHQRLAAQAADSSLSARDLAWVEAQVAARAKRSEPPWIVAEGALGLGIVERTNRESLEKLFALYWRAFPPGTPIAIRCVGGGKGNGRRYAPIVEAMRNELTLSASRALRLLRGSSPDDVRPALRAAVARGDVDIPSGSFSDDARRELSRNVRLPALHDVADLAWLFCVARAPITATEIGGWERADEGGRPADFPGWADYVATHLLHEDVQRPLRNAERAHGKADARQGPRVAAEVFVDALATGIDSSAKSRSTTGY